MSSSRHNAVANRHIKLHDVDHLNTSTMEEKRGIAFYTAASPNGYKVAITLEELRLSYDMVHVDVPAIQHKEPWFMAINPNGRVPALTDTLDDGTSISLFESGSIQQYLVDRYDSDHKISYPRGTKEFHQTINWVRSIRAVLEDMIKIRGLKLNTAFLPECRNRADARSSKSLPSIQYLYGTRALLQGQIHERNLETVADGREALE